MNVELWDMIGYVFLFGLIYTAVAVYMLPSLIAMARNTNNRSYVAIINGFLGWSVIGWVIALAMATEGKKRQT